MRRFAPASAIELLRSKRVADFACDVVKNPAFAKARATTRDADGLRVADHVAAPPVGGWAAEVERTLNLPPSAFAEEMDNHPVRQTRIPKPEGGAREIGVPDFLRRCVSNALNEVLTVTADPQLPHCVRAYRHGRGDSVRDTLLDVAEAVRSGRVTYFAKLDFKSFFTEMPWWAIREALQHYGYPPEFIDVVMATVECPLVTRRKGRLVAVSNNKGAQMGLAESAMLANLVPWRLDSQLSGRQSLVYYRYSDDIFVGSSSKSEVVRAVREVAAWCRDHELKLKGVQQNTRLAGLVLDVRRSRIPLLGAEIDCNGYVHMPRAKLSKKLTQLDEMSRHLQHGEVRGTSRYGDGGGVAAHDHEDLTHSMTAFLDYWSGLDPRATQRAREIFERRFPSTPDSNEPGPGTVWVAQLWGRQTNHGAGNGPVVHTPAHTATCSTPRRNAPPGQRQGGEKDRPQAESLSTAKFAQSRDSGDPEPSSMPSVPLRSGKEEAAACSGIPGRTEGSLSTGEVPFDQGGEEARLLDADGQKTYRFDTPSLTYEDPYLDFNYFNCIEIDLREGAVGDPAGGASPPRPVFENTPCVHLHGERLRLGDEEMVLVGSCHISAAGVASPPTTRLVRRSRRGAAVVQEAIRHVRGAGSSLTITLSESWLPKQLLQPNRTLRAPLLFSRVLELHAASRGKEVLLTGGIEPPKELLEAVQTKRDALVRRRALAGQELAQPGA